MLLQRQVCLLLGLFLPILGSNLEFYDIEFAVNLTKQLFVKHQLETSVIFSKERKLQISADPQLIIRSLERTLMEDLGIPLIICSHHNNMSMKEILTRHTLVLAFIDNFTPDQEPLLEITDKTLNNRHGKRLLFTIKRLLTIPPTQEQMEQFFEWCWQRNFINVALTFQWVSFYNNIREVRNELFTYTPFPKLKLCNVTKFGINYDWPLPDLSNVQDYQFKVPVFQDALSVFQLPNGELSGSMGLLFSAYIANIKGRLKVVATPDVNQDNYHDHTLLAAARNEIDLGVHYYTKMTLNSDLVDGISTSFTTKTCLIVPWQRYLSMDKILRKTIYIIKIWCIVLLVALPLAWQICMRDGGRGLSYGLAVYIMQPLESQVFQRFITPYKYIHISTLICSFLLWNIRSAVMASMLSTKNLEPQIHSTDDFLQTSLRIMLTETQISMYFDRNLLPNRLRSRFMVVNASALEHHLNNLNTSYAYLVTSEFWKIIELQQGPLNRPLFQRESPKLCTPKFVKYIPMRRNSPFERHFALFYNSFHRFGFMKIWLGLSALQAREMGLWKMHQGNFQPLQYVILQDFFLPLKVYLALNGVAISCFFCELLWKCCHQWIRRRMFYQ